MIFLCLRKRKKGHLGENRGRTNKVNDRHKNGVAEQLCNVSVLISSFTDEEKVKSGGLILH